jgi:DNA mismatch endonuclease, patch repair protein
MVFMATDNELSARRFYAGRVAESWASSPGVRASMRSNKGRDTKPERELRSAVHALGLRYRVSVRPLKAVRRTADLAFTRDKVAVFLDGCFWHGCPDHHTVAVTNAEFWATKVETNMARDRDTDRRLAEAGWVVVRVWEHEDPGDAAQRVRDVVLARRTAAER